MPKKDITVRVSSDGKAVYGLYDDNLPYRELGKVETIRASDVRMNKDGFWEVYIISEDKILPKAFRDRKDAIAYEVEYLNQISGDSILSLFK